MEQTSKVKVAVIVCIATLSLLAACEPKLWWRDVSGQNRPKSVEDNDVAACEKRFEPNPFPEHMPQDQWAEIWGQIKACMADKGWMPIQRGNSKLGHYPLAGIRTARLRPSTRRKNRFMAQTPPKRNVRRALNFGA